MAGGDSSRGSTQRLLALLALAFLAGAVALLPRPATAAPGWEIVLDRPTPNFGGIDFVSDTEGWMTAGAGLLHTTDGGATWTEAAKITVNDVDFFDQQHGWAVGPYGAIFGTSDGGETWSQQESGLEGQMYFTDLEVISPSEAWAVALEDTSDTPHFPAGAVLHTTDGGASWQQVELPERGAFSQIDFVGATGWLLGSICNPSCSIGETARALLRTVDGGASWSLVENLPEGASSMEFLDDLHGWVATSRCNGRDCSPSSRTHMILRTEDGGQTWHGPDVTQYGAVRDLAFSDAHDGWAAVVGGVLVTTDGGQSWSQVSSTSVGSYINIYQGALFLTGGGTALRSTNGGDSWENMRHPALALTHLDFIDRQTGFAFDGALLRTNNAGRTWERRGSPSATGQSRLRDLKFFDGSTGVAVFEGCEPTCRIDVIQTSDGGDSWSIAATLPHERGFEFKTLQTGANGAAVAAAYRGLAVTTDYGATWTTRDVPPVEGSVLMGAAMLDRTHLWAATYPEGGGPSVLVASSDAGETWYEIYRGLPLGDIEFFDAQHGWARAGEEYLHTSDGGRAWATITLPTTNRAYDVAFADPVNGWASVAWDCGDSCRFPLIHTADGGETWTPQPFEGPDDAVAHDLEFVDARTGWFTTSPAQIFGLGGNPPDRTILYHTTDGGGGPIDEVPQDLPDVGARPDAGSAGGLASVLLAAAGAVAFGAAFALRRRP